MKSRLKRLFGCGLLLMLAGCEPQNEDAARPQASASPTSPDIFGSPPPAARWYSPAQVLQGEKVYVSHCQVCHLPKGQGAPNWREPLPTGQYPPPPLDGSAHAWHHPLADLLQTVNNGSQASGGQMPAFRNTLTEGEKQAVIAYIQSLWPDPIYAAWHSRVNAGQPKPTK